MCCSGRDLRGGGLWQSDGRGGSVHRDLRAGRDQPGDWAGRRAAGLGAHGRHHGAGGQFLQQLVYNFVKK